MLRAARRGASSLRAAETSSHLPLPDLVHDMDHPLSRLRTDLLQGHTARVNALEQTDPGAEQNG